MSLVDALIVLLMLLFAVSGYRQGFVVGVLSFSGFLGGALLGLWVGPLVTRQIADPGARVAVALISVFGLALLVQGLALWLGTRLRRAIRAPAGRLVDDIGGAVVSVVAVALVAWLAAVPLSSSPLPWLNRAVRDSAVLEVIDRAVPQPVRTWTEALRDAVDTRGFLEVFGVLTPTREPDVPAGDPALVNSPVVRQAAASVVRVLGSAPDCRRRIEGSGFVYTTGYVMTNAHVVAGTSSVRVEWRGVRVPALVVAFDPALDLAVLYAPTLSAPALPMAERPAARGDDAIVLGYPLSGPFDVRAARIRDRRDITGPDIYGSSRVTREVYTIRALVRSGNSGGPLLSPDGEVLGVIFAAADDPTTGFAVTAQEAAPVAEAGAGRTAPVDTGSCT